MELTLIVQVFNEKSTILQAIKEAKELKIDKEIIIIDNHSKYGTQEMLKNLKDDSLQIIFQPILSHFWNFLLDINTWR